MRCIECGKYPFCLKIEDSQKDACEHSIKRPLNTTVTRKDVKKYEQETEES